MLAGRQRADRRVLFSFLMNCFICDVLQLESLPLLTPTQVAELTLSSGLLNNTHLISAVFDRLEQGDALDNVEEFLTALS